MSLSYTRLYDLRDDSLEKMENRKYIRKGFICLILSMGVIWMSLTLAFLSIDEWNRSAFMKGLVSWIFIIFIKEMLPKFKSLYSKYKNNLHKFFKNQ